VNSKIGHDRAFTSFAVAIHTILTVAIRDYKTAAVMKFHVFVYGEVPPYK